VLPGLFFFFCCCVSFSFYQFNRRILQQNPTRTTTRNEPWGKKTKQEKKINPGRMCGELGENEPHRRELTPFMTSSEKKN
jgi:hypothetical protein